MRRNIHREWVMLVREDDGLATWVFEPLRRKEISVRLKRGWKMIG
ncbi:hypothetical protein [Mesobacillus sp. S13]|nr:hypothetical protein [Mesobacillus sp. S13]